MIPVQKHVDVGSLGELFGIPVVVYFSGFAEVPEDGGALVEDPLFSLGFFDHDRHLLEGGDSFEFLIGQVFTLKQPQGFLVVLDVVQVTKRKNCSRWLTYSINVKC